MTQLMPNMWIILLTISINLFFMIISMNYFDYELIMKMNLMYKINKW